MNAAAKAKDLKTCLIYCRTSSENINDEKVSIPNQEDACLALASRMGLKVVEVIKEPNRSGSLWPDHPAKELDYDAKQATRPGFSRVIKMIEAGKVDCVVVYDTTRLARPASTFFSGWLLSFFKRFAVVSVEAGRKLDYGDFATLLTEQTKVAVNRNQIDLTARKSSESKARIKAEGGIVSRPVYGYASAGKGKVVIDEVQAGAVRMIFDLWTTKGMGLNLIGRALHAAGYNAMHGGSWQAGQIAKMLKHPGYCGMYRDPQGTLQPSKAYTTPIISRTQWDMAQAVKRECHALGRSKRDLGTYWMSGTLFCGHCGQPLTLTCGTDKWAKEPAKRVLGYRYACVKVNCSTHASIPCKDLETYGQAIIDMVDNYIKEHGDFACYKASVDGGVLEELRTLEASIAIMKETRRKYLKSALALEDLQAALEGVDDKIKESQGKIDVLLQSIRSTYPVAGSSQAKWQWLCWKVVVTHTPRALAITMRLGEDVGKVLMGSDGVVKCPEVISIPAEIVRHPKTNQPVLKWVTDAGKAEIDRVVSAILAWDDHVRTSGTKARMKLHKDR